MTRRPYDANPTGVDDETGHYDGGLQALVESGRHAVLHGDGVV